MKRLKLRAVLSPRKDTCTIHILEQSHRGLDFGVNDYNAGSFRLGNIRLYSYRRARHDQLGGGLRLYLLGTEHDSDGHITGVPSKYWPEIKEAVKAYNEYYSDEKIEERRLADEQTRKKKVKRANTMYSMQWDAPMWTTYTSSYDFDEQARAISYVDIQRAAEILSRGY